MSKFKVLDLFSGCGGLSNGFEASNLFEVIVANELWAPAQLSWCRNHKGKMIGGDITSKDIQDRIVAEFDGVKCDIVAGGPPCVAYSMSGRRDPNDPRGKLFEQYVSIVGRLMPSAFVMENVKGILSMKHDEGMVTDLISKKFDEIGYNVTYRTLLASEYGVPQNRERVIFIGSRKDLNLKWEWPNKTHGSGLLPMITVENAIGDLISVDENKDWSHIFPKHSKDFIDKISQTKIGSSVSGYSESFLRVHPDRPSPTVKANNGSVFIHYGKNRCVSPRELARLQSFDDSFIFLGGKQDILKQIGNAVPPRLAKAIAEEVGKMLS